MNLKHWLVEHDISQVEIAQVCKQTPGTVSLKMNGKVAWQQRDLKALHDAYGLSADFVLGFSDAPYGGPTGGSDRKIHVGRRWRFE